ncbi:sensor domain-containing diguanylate cyclase [Yoonia sp. 2307UL14-13]|uniref:sensor domain-containing diguanylate cyclase n=1 Tax=Yoonia sp. 2307UL14-13 TaxID=3126506 RepID=UPI0030958E68
MTERPEYQAIFDAAAQAHDDAAELSVPIGFLRELGAATTQTDILRTYSAWSRRIVGAERCSIALDTGQQTLRVSSMDGSKGIAHGAHYDIHTTLAGAVFRRKQGIFVPNITQVPSPGLIQLAQMGYRALAAAPLVTASRCLGVIFASFHAQIDQPAAIKAKLEAIGCCLATQLLIVEQMEALATQARTDPLTGAQNRYALYDQAAQLWQNWKQDQTPFSFVSVDVDYFKQINDTYGHDVGDGVLCTLVKRIMARGRPDDGCVRMGGEEFGLLMANTGIEIAMAQAARLCDTIGGSPFAIGDRHLDVTASFGVTTVYTADHGFDDVLKRADRALYRAKEGGRDQVVWLEGADMAA